MNFYRDLMRRETSAQGFGNDQFRRKAINASLRLLKVSCSFSLFANCHESVMESEVQTDEEEVDSETTREDTTAEDEKKIIEIVCSGFVVVVLALNGYCAAFDTRTKSQINKLCILNGVSTNEVIRSLYFNKSNESLVTISVWKEDGYSTLRCRSIPKKSIMDNNPQKGENLFEKENLSWPGFIEFDDTNQKILTFSSREWTYKVWKMSDYSQIFMIKKSHSIKGIKISPGFLMVWNTYKTNISHIRVKILDVESGKVLKVAKCILPTLKKIQFIEHYLMNIFVKQEQCNLIMINLQTNERITIDDTSEVSPDNFIFLFEKRLFLTLMKESTIVRNFHGVIVTILNSDLLYKSCHEYKIYINSTQDLILSCIEKKFRKQGSLVISDVVHGECVARFSGENNVLSSISTLYFNEDINEVYVGDKKGNLIVWSS